MKLKLADSLGIQLAVRAEQDAQIRVLDGDLCDSDGAIEFARRHPSRFIMAGIAEQNMVSMAAGLATVGMRPWVFSFAAFLTYRAYDQVRVSVSQPGVPVVLVGSHAGGLAGRNGKTHAALNDLALMCTLPRMDVWAPADVEDVTLAIERCSAASGPAYIRLPRATFSITDRLPAAIGLERWIRPRQDLTIVTTGLGTRWVLAALPELDHLGLEVGFLHLPQLRPLPDLQTLSGVTRIVVVEDHGIVGGLGSLILHAGLNIPVKVIGWPSSFAGKSGADDDILAAYGLSTADLVSVILHEQRSLPKEL